MKVPPNLLRSQVEDFERIPNWLSTKQLERRNRILRVGTHLLALHGLRDLRICDVALAMNLTSASIRYLFADLDALLIEIIREHLKAINTAIGTIHATDPEAVGKRRAAYLAATRGEFGILTEAHLLLIRDATMLSEANYAAIQQSHDQHGLILAGTLDPETALTLLDAPRLDPIRIQTTLATLEGTDPAIIYPLYTPAPASEPEPELEPIEPSPELSPELAWSDDLAQIPDDLLSTYPDGQTPGAWIYNKNLARSPPKAA
jgi:AcrR family transcriptional regulator